ncbi:MAG TPA: flagellar hook-length control protein FliK [Phenylobacterium sp.]|nr:flagellar hook-length control protein FliK [Phenylobacterium sp.]
MSAQAVLSMIASALPAAQRGQPGRNDASGFQSLLSAMLSGEAEAGRDTVVESDDGAARPLIHSKASADAEPLILPGQADAKAPEPQVLPGEVAAKGPEPLVLPGDVAVKPSEPEVLPDVGENKDAGPQVLPGVAVAKDPGAQVLPGVPTAKSSDPQVLPGAPTTKDAGRQVLPGAEEVAPAVVTGEDTAEVVPWAAAGSPSKTGASVAQTLPHPAPAPLRALAERTSKPLEEGTSAAPSSSADAKTAASAMATASPSPDQPVKAVAQAAPATAGPQAEAPVPEEGQSSGGLATTQTEAAAPARDHSLSTLSRATIDATAQIAAQILRKLEGRSTRFEITLKPAELGRVDVKLDVDSEGRLAARLAFDNPAAATDLRGRADELRRQLEQAGFQLADDAFEFAERDSGSSAFDRGQDARHGQNRAFKAAARLKSEIDMAQPPQWLALSLSPAGVDMKV